MRSPTIEGVVGAPAHGIGIPAREIERGARRGRALLVGLGGSSGHRDHRSTTARARAAAAAAVVVGRGMVVVGGVVEVGVGAVVVEGLVEGVVVAHGRGGVAHDHQLRRVGAFSRLAKLACA